MTFFIAFCFLIIQAQPRIDCQKAAQYLPAIEKKINKIKTDDPEVIALHFLFVKDMQEELQNFRNNYLPQLHLCPEMDFYPTVRRCDTIEAKLKHLYDTLAILRNKVDVLFYEHAVEELYSRDTILCMYLLDRSLQYNRLQTDALILKLKLLFQAQQYDECISLIHLLYNEAPLQRHHENELSDFTTLFYDKLFTLGDSLVRIEHATEALTIFETLETFCHDMPTAYCNDDYYYGIIRSKTGICESYLTIAKVAWEKKNDEIAYKFLDYAEQYLAENEDNVTLNEEFVRFKQQLILQRANEEKEVPLAPAEKEEKQTIFLSPAINLQKQTEYDQLLKEAMRLFKTDGFDEAWSKLKRARAIETCDCVRIDFRVQVLYDELAKYYR